MSVPSPSLIWRPALTGHSPKPTPWLAWVLAAGVGVLGAMAATEVKNFVGVLGLIIIALTARAILARPLTGFLLVVSLFPYYAIFRGLVGMYNIPLPMGVIGLWPEALLVCMLASLVLRAIRSGERLQFTWMDLPALLMLAAGVYGAALTVADNQPVAGLYGFHTSVTPLCFYFIGRWLKVTPRDLQLVVRFWLANFIVIAVGSVADYFTRTDFMIRLAIQVRPGYGLPVPPLIFYKIYPRMQSLLYTEQMWGTLCAFVALYGFGKMAILRSATRWAQWLAIILLSLLCMALSMSRGAFVCFGVAALAALFFRGRHRPVMIVGAALLILVGASLYVRFQENPKVISLVSRVADLQDTDNRQNSAYDRVEQWEKALAVFPLFPAGRGLGRVSSSGLIHGTSDALYYVADGGYFKILAETGVPGILLFCLGAFGFIPVLFGAWRRANPEERPLAFALFCLYLGFLVQNIAGNVFDFWYLQHAYWLLAGTLLAPRLSRPAVPTQSASLKIAGSAAR